MSIINFHIIREKLNEHDVKATQQRIVIYAALIYSKEHPTTESVFEKIKESNPSISLATVYKTLETFVEKGLIKKVMTDDGYMRYDGMTEPHHHIYCTDTHEIVDYDDDELLVLIKSYLAKKEIKNLSIESICVQVNGKKIDKNKSISIK